MANIVPLQCTVCRKQFSGPVPASQHFVSKEHRQKEENSRREHLGNYCDVCNIACDTPNILHLHKQSPKHQALEQKQKAMSNQAAWTTPQHHAPNSALSSGVSTPSRASSIDTDQTSSYVFNGNTQTGYCYICKLELTSGAHANDHLKGKPHKKKIIQKSTIEYNDSSPKVQEIIKYNSLCTVCQVVFTGPQCAYQHYISQKHKMKEALAKNEGMTIPVGNPGPYPAIANQKLMCDVCQVPFTGPENAQQHFDSEKHKKKEALVKNRASPMNNVSSGYQAFDLAMDKPVTEPDSAAHYFASETHKKKEFLSKNEFVGRTTTNASFADTLSSEHMSTSPCTICQVSFTGPENAQQHYASEKHKKKLEVKEKHERGEALPLTCNACGCSFTGQENAEAHFMSKKHKRNEENTNIRCFSGTASSSILNRPEATHFQTHAQVNRPSYISSTGIAQNHGGNTAFSVNINSRVDEMTDKLDRTHIKAESDEESEVNAKPFPIERRESLSKTLNIKEIESDAVRTSEENRDERTKQHTTRENTFRTQSPVETFRETDVTKIDIINSEESVPRSRCQPDVAFNEDLQDQLDMGDEEKIKAETYSSMTENQQYNELTSFTSSNTGNWPSIDSSEQSLRDNEPIRFVKNDLNNISSISMPAVGRGRGFWQLGSQQNNTMLGKLLNKNRTTPNETNEDSNTLSTTMRETDIFHNKEENTKLLTVWSNSGTDLQKPSDVKTQAFGSDSDSTSDDENNALSEHNEKERNDMYQKSKVDLTLTQHVGHEEDHTIPLHESDGAFFTYRKYEKENLLPADQIHMWNVRSESPLDKYGGFDKRKTSSESDGSITAEEYHFSSTTNRGRCNVCSIELTSKNHMSQHLSGKNHARARVIWREMISSDVFERNPFICKVCRVSFSGMEAREQHFQSQKHKAKEMELESGGQELYCDVCKISCSGAVNIEQHIDGAQHKKMMDLRISNGSTSSSPFDQTAWHPCKTCGCSLNTLEQLRIHEKSPRHLAKTRLIHSANEFVIPGMNQAAVINSDRTVWYPCHVCNCQMNTQEQLNIHNKSPKHLAKLQKAQPSTHSYVPSHNSDPSLLTTNYESRIGDPRHAGHVTPLDSFLSEELFPEEFMPKHDEETFKHVHPPNKTPNETPFHLEISDAPVPIQPRFAVLPEVSHTQRDEDERDMTGRGGSKRGQGSDLAWATRSKGTGDNRTGGKDEERNPKSSTHLAANLISPFVKNEPNGYLGARPKEPTNTHTNPYAATHQYYCHSCKAPMNTRESYESHLRGKRHMKKVSTEPAPSRAHLLPRELGSSFVPQTTTEPRNYQRELYQKAMAADSLCFLPTGTGKTLVAVMTISAMLQKHPSKNVLFLVDKVLLVIQQSQYIKQELQDKYFDRYIPDSETCTDIERRRVRIAAVCMGQQNTEGVPLWMHDVVVVTAAFCQNLLDSSILRWSDFSLVVFDEAHHCEKSHPFSTLLREYHSQTFSPLERPKVLGLTASPAGKSDVPKTLQMLQSLVLNMGGVRMCVVEDSTNVQTLKELQSNAKIIIRPQVTESHSSEDKFRHELRVYILQCYLNLMHDSNIKYFIDLGKEMNLNIGEKEVAAVAAIIESYLDEIQSSLGMLDSDTMDKVMFSRLTSHVQSICMTLNSLSEGGILFALEEIAEMESRSHNFDFAKSIGLPCEPLQNLVRNAECGGKIHGSGDEKTAQAYSHVRQLIEELTGARVMDGSIQQASRTISLVLVKERGTAHRITRMLQDSEEMRRHGLNTTTVVGHGGGGSGERGMSVNQQKRVLEEIKQYKYQVIIATSVAEEGVDWPECERVISMYPPSTVTALVQMRGRARKKNSKFIVLCASDDEEEKLNDIISREKNMIIATHMLVEQSKHAEE